MTMKKFIPRLVILGLALFAVAAGAADLDQAKRDGLVGERADGFLGLVVEQSPSDVVALVAEVNAKRMAEYQRIAREHNLTVEQVQALAGKKTVEKTAGGNYILINGGWQRK